MKKFLISIDTEGDDFFNWSPGDEITTKNARYVPRFQELCDKYGFRPTYLTNYEMANDGFFVGYAKQLLIEHRCEIGMHLHAWNSPPLFELNNRVYIRPGDCSFLIEYPEEIIRQKISYLTDLLEKRFGNRPVVHRAGRWTTNQLYFDILNEEGYLVDCSVTPGMDMSSAKGFTDGSRGTDYTDAPINPYIIPGTSVLEIPMTVRENHCIKKDNDNRIRHKARNVYKAWKGRGPIWLRPNGSNLQEMLYLANVVLKEKTTDYLMFMLHTSEMMPGCSKAFKTEESIEKMYSDLDVLFAKVAENYCGCTIGDYASDKIKEFQ